MNKYLKSENYLNYARAKYIYLLWIILILRGKLRIKDYILWKKSLQKTGSGVNGMPWITLGAIKWLDSFVDDKKNVFEWGSGGSTIYFSKKTKRVISVEHNKDWWVKVKDFLESKKLNSNCEYRLVEPEEKVSVTSKKEEWLYSSSESEKLSYRKYCQAIDQYPDESFDLVVIDGRSRNSCLLKAIPKVKKSGAILLDNSERTEYKLGTQLLSKWKRKDFFGPVLYSFSVSQTSIFVKP